MSWCSSRTAASRLRPTLSSPRRSSPTSRSTAHMAAVQPSASRTGSPVIWRVRTRLSGSTMRNSPSIGRPSTRQPVTMAVSFGWSSGRRTDGRSSRESGGTRGPAEDLVQLLGPAHLVGQEVPFGAAHPLRRETGGRRVVRRGAALPCAATPGGGPALSWPRCWSRLSRCWTARSQRARCQRAWGSSSSVAAASRPTAATSPRNCRARWIRASTASCAGAAVRGGPRTDGTASRTPIQARRGRVSGAAAIDFRTGRGGP